MKYIGIDLHSTNSVIAVLDEQEEVLYCQRHRNELPTILAALSPYIDDTHGVVIESTYNWYWLVDGLQEAGYHVLLANTTALPQYSGLKHRDDRSDAIHLARLLHLDLLPTGHIFPRELRGIRDLMRRRAQLVETRTQQLLAIETQFMRCLGQRPSAAVIKRLNTAALDKYVLTMPEREGILANLRVMHSITAALDAIEAAVTRAVGSNEGIALLQTIPGVGPVLARTIWLESGDMRRFASVGNYASYCRCVGSTYLSNGKRKGTGNRRNGNRYLAWAYLEAAHSAVNWLPAAKAYYQRKSARSHHMVALKALAHKLARACYYMLRDGVAFDEHRIFG